MRVIHASAHDNPHAIQVMRIGLFGYQNSPSTTALRVVSRFFSGGVTRANIEGLVRLR
jgi:hypothetical protein